MADLFEEFGALEFEPKKGPKLPKFPKPRKPILWLCVAAVVCIAAGIIWGIMAYENQEPEVPPLEKCRLALEDYRNQEYSYVHLEKSTYSTYRLTIDLWRCGEDVYYISTVNDAMSEGCLQSGGEQYYYHESYGWQAMEFSVNNLSVPFLDTYTWEEATVTLVSQQAVGAGEKITLQIDTLLYPDRGSMGVNVENYTVCLRLDETGALTAMTLIYVQNREEIMQTYQIGSTSREETAQIIGDAYQTVTDEIKSEYYPAYSRFVEVLEEFRSHGVYCVERSQQSDEHILYGNSTIWRCGEDILVLGTNSRDGYLIKNGSQLYLNIGSEPEQRVWTEIELPEDLLTIPWLETYKLDFDNVLSAMEYATDSADLILVVFRGDPYPEADSGVEQHSVCLTVENGVLTNVDLAYTGEDGGMHTSTFQILSTTREEIEKTIDEAYQEAVSQIQ